MDFLKKAFPYIIPVLIGLAFLPVPLLRDFHFESAMLAGIIGCFWGGINASSVTAKNDFFAALRISGSLYLAAVPLFLMSFFSGCLTFDGFSFWLLTPLPSVFLGTAIGRLFRLLSIPYPRVLTLLSILFIAAGVWLIEFFHFPQVYFYNHVWGYWPGPIYDESVTVSGSYLYFRWITFLWILLFWMIPSWDKTRQTKLITFLAFFSLLFGYLNLDEAGIITPREKIQATLDGQIQTDHFHLYYDNSLFNKDEVDYWAERHEFYFQEITDQLNIIWPGDRIIESYMYGDAWQKKALTGAKFTSYVPIWLEQDQLHIAKQQLDGVLKHEMVHVIAKQFGNSLLNGSRSIGFIEGLAEGIAKDASSRSTLHQIVAADHPLPSTRELRSAFSIYGFYGSAGSISYTTTGSFVEYLLKHYPAAMIKNAYPTGDIEKAFGQPLDTLVADWQGQLNTTMLDSVDQRVSEYIFAQQSLFQKECPHSVSREMQLWDTYQYLLAEQDTGKAYSTLDRLYTLDTENALVKDEWVRSQLMNGRFEEAAGAITQKDSLLTLQVLKADALFLTGKSDQAEKLLSLLTPRIQASGSPTFAYTLSLREDSLQWSYHVKRRYNNEWPDSADFKLLNNPNQMLTLQKILKIRRTQELLLISRLLLDTVPDEHWFDIYDATIDWLAYRREFKLAQKWLQKIESIPHLRLRYKERLHEQQSWLEFLQKHKMVAD